MARKMTNIKNLLINDIIPQKKVVKRIRSKSLQRLSPPAVSVTDAMTKNNTQRIFLTLPPGIEVFKFGTD